MAKYKTYSTMGVDENAPDLSNVPAIPRITSMQERKALVRGNILTVIDNYADWCGPCKKFAPHFASLAAKYFKPGVCAFAKENVEDECGSWPVPVRGVPCYHFYMNGQFLEDEIMTGTDLEAISDTIERLLGSRSSSRK